MKKLHKIITVIAILLVALVLVAGIDATTKFYNFERIEVHLSYIIVLGSYGIVLANSFKK